MKRVLVCLVALFILLMSAPVFPATNTNWVEKYHMTNRTTLVIDGKVVNRPDYPDPWVLVITLRVRIDNEIYSTLVLRRECYPSESAAYAQLDQTHREILEHLGDGY